MRMRRVRACTDARWRLDILGVEHDLARRTRAMDDELVRLGSLRELEHATDDWLQCADAQTRLNRRMNLGLFSWSTLSHTNRQLFVSSTRFTGEAGESVREQMYVAP